MNLAAVGVSHHTAPVEIRERVAFSPADALKLMEKARSDLGIEEAVVLSTCNRTEVYLHAREQAPDSARVRALLERRAGLDGTLSEFVYERAGISVARHLFRVVAGLDAMVVGEAEIQGQVRQAYALAAEGVEGQALAGPVLHRLFQMALAAGGRVRSETSLGQGTASVSYVAVQLARKIFGSLKGKRVLIMGAGETSELVVKALSREGVSGVVVANRTYERAETLARRLEGRAVELGRIAEELSSVDVVVSSTSAPHPILRADTVWRAFPGGLRRPLLIMDLAIPRDVDPAAGEEPNVFLYNVDDLRQIVDAHVAQRRQAVPEAEAIVQEITGEFRGWYATQEAVPVIRSLRDRGDHIRQEELARLLGRWKDITPEQQEMLEHFSRRLINKLLHDPTARLREGADRRDGVELIDAARFLYGLDADVDAEAQPTSGEMTEDHDEQ